MLAGAAVTAKSAIIAELKKTAKDLSEAMGVRELKKEAKNENDGSTQRKIYKGKRRKLCSLYLGWTNSRYNNYFYFF